MLENRAKSTNGLDDGQAERLALLLEELGEAQQAIGKVLRHGYKSSNPDDPLALSNQVDLEHEAGHVFAALDLLVLSGDLRGHEIEIGRDRKHDKLPRYLHHQPANLMRTKRGI